MAKDENVGKTVFLRNFIVDEQEDCVTDAADAASSNENGALFYEVKILRKCRLERTSTFKTLK